MGIVWDSVKVMVLGMGTVFVALIGLVFIVKALRRATDSKEQPQSAVKSDQAVEPAEKIGQVEDAVQLQERNEEDDELIAIITAAVAASLHRSTHDIVVRSIRRVPAITPVWNRVGRQEQIANRL